MQTAKNNRAGGLTGRLVVSVLAIACLAAAGGCDELVNLDNVASWGGLADPWYTSSLGLPGYSTLYDPTSTIQSVIDYRQGVMDSVADGWSDYILQ